MKGRTARADGGKTESPKKGVKVTDSDKGADWYSGETSNVKKEAEQPTGFRKGGKVGAKVDGDKAKDRLDRPKRKSGGRIARASGGEVASGSRSPFSKAEKTSDRPGGDMD